MTTIKLRTLFLASALGLATITSASAFGTPQIPTPVNPHPEFPIATDGSPLPPMGWAQQRYVNQRGVQGLGWDEPAVDERAVDLGSPLDVF